MILKLEFTEKEMQNIEDTFLIIKRGGSKLATKEEMCQLFINKETSIYTFLNYIKGENEGENDKNR